MSGVGAVGGYSSAYNPYSVVAGGGALQSAAQDTAGKAIEEKTEAQTRGLDQGTENLNYAKSALNIEDGAMEGITDYLQSIKELAVKAKNDLLTKEDKSYIQGQIDQYIQGINDIAGGTTFNEHHLLDGSEEDLAISSDGNGSSSTVPTFNSTAEALGISGFNVMNDDFDLKTIDDALTTVQNNRTTVGAKTNGVEYSMNYNSRASLELNGYAMDNEEDRAMNALMDVKKKQALDQYQIMIQKKQQEANEQKTNLFM